MRKAFLFYAGKKSMPIKLKKCCRGCPTVLLCMAGGGNLFRCTSCSGIFLYLSTWRTIRVETHCKGQGLKEIESCSWHMGRSGVLLV